MECLVVFMFGLGVGVVLVMLGREYKFLRRSGGGGQ